MAARRGRIELRSEVRSWPGWGMRDGGEGEGEGDRDGQDGQDGQGGREASVRGDGRWAMAIRRVWRGGKGKGRCRSLQVAAGRGGRREVHHMSVYRRMGCGRGRVQASTTTRRGGDR